MAYLLDSDILIFQMRGHEKVRQRMRSIPMHQLHTSIISCAELWCGQRIRKSGDKQNALLQEMLDALTVLPFSQHSVQIFADVKAMLHRSGNIIQDFDIAIASIALEHQLILVTNNVKDFGRIRGLKVENWAV